MTIYTLNTLIQRKRGKDTILNLTKTHIHTCTFKSKVRKMKMNIHMNIQSDISPTHNNNTSKQNINTSIKI